MADEGLDFNEALELAKKNGFAEANPIADLEGLDIARKINIISSLAFSGAINNDDIYCFGISNVTKDILDKVKELGYTLKYVASSYKNDNNQVSIRVEPTMVPFNHPFASIKYEFNAILFTGSTNDDLMFYGLFRRSIQIANGKDKVLPGIIKG